MVSPEVILSLVACALIGLVGGALCGRRRERQTTQYDLSRPFMQQK